eukprot:CAMPEP_0205802590 /NCGR_PEP_ID=MMETSP0205-20121125/4983_1 /ASSEMBLY_ACC=CAM_ASM_000278 /TAXON_ID=36767 /ORGANISM="Euplotes focardii, Strain TN1" /LENGTH=59 /DNA_ID=CAMNT_0053069299 /DNA_START=1150 /DNA_END=1329 /DNA_ORIENTATION=+
MILSQQMISGLLVNLPNSMLEKLVLPKNLMETQIPLMSLAIMSLMNLMSVREDVLTSQI